MDFMKLYESLLKFLKIRMHTDNNMHKKEKLSQHETEFNTPQDLLSNLESLANDGNHAAFFDLGQLYYQGDKGVKKDIFKAITYFIKAAENGIPEGAYQLGKIYGTGIEDILPADQFRSFVWYTQAAKYGLSEAQNNLGSCYFFGRGVRVDYEEAFKLYMMSAEKGNSEAEMNVGICYAAGKGVELDYTLAYSWWKKAAEHGHVKAMVNLATCYEMGVGVIQNKYEACRWYKNAAEQGDAYAAKKMNSVGA